MHQIQEEIGIPKVKTESIGENHVLFTMSPLPTGYGVTLGNALRRILLSSLPGACVTGIKIAGISHEYSTVKGLKESLLDLCLNLKLLNIKKDTSDISYVKLDVSKGGKITAKDISCPSEVQIINPELYICTSEKGTKLEIEMRVEKGVGYVPASVRQKMETDANMIVLDAGYTRRRIHVRHQINSRKRTRTTVQQTSTRGLHSS